MEFWNALGFMSHVVPRLLFRNRHAGGILTKRDIVGHAVGTPGLAAGAATTTKDPLRLKTMWCKKFISSLVPLLVGDQHQHMYAR